MAKISQGMKESLVPLALDPFFLADFWRTMLILLHVLKRFIETILTKYQAFFGQKKNSSQLL